MHPEIVAGATFISTSKLQSRMSNKAIDEDIDGIMRMTVNILSWNCSLGPGEQLKLSCTSRPPQRPGAGGNSPSLPDKPQLLPNYPHSVFVLKSQGIPYVLCSNVGRKETWPKSCRLVWITACFQLQRLLGG